MVRRRFSPLKENAWRVVFFLSALVVGLSLTWTTAVGRSPLWQLLFWYAVILIATSAFTSSSSSFFLGKTSSISLLQSLEARVRGKRAEAKEGAADADARQHVSFWVLMPSAFITWIFAKSIYNSAVLAGKYGILGGFSYAAWYVSFWSAALVGYMLRTRHGYSSLIVAVDTLYGPVAAVGFGLALLVRLFNEVWSNTTVVAMFYGERDSAEWWVAVALSSAVPLSYVLMGGMRSSLTSDVAQALLSIVFLVVVLGVIGTRYNEAIESGAANGTAGSVFSYEPPGGVDDEGEEVPGGWQEGGWTLLAVGLIQGAWSYPFMDPVLTDRTFLSTPRTMLLSFAVGGAVAFTFIVLFGGIGIYGCSLATPPQAGFGNPVAVSKALGGASELFITLVMMSSSLSTLDSTFTAAGKCVALELGGWFSSPATSGRRAARCARTTPSTSAGTTCSSRARDAPRRPPRHALPRDGIGAAGGDDDGDGDGDGPRPADLPDARVAVRRGRQGGVAAVAARVRLPFLAGVGFGLASNKVFNPTYAETGVRRCRRSARAATRTSSASTSTASSRASVSAPSASPSTSGSCRTSSPPSRGRGWRRSRTSRTRRLAPASPRRRRRRRAAVVDRCLNARRRRVDPVFSRRISDAALLLLHSPGPTGE